MQKCNDITTASQTEQNVLFQTATVKETLVRATTGTFSPKRHQTFGRYLAYVGYDRLSPQGVKCCNSALREKEVRSHIIE